jgi:hypothetical protein
VLLILNKQPIILLVKALPRTIASLLTMPISTIKTKYPSQLILVPTTTILICPARSVLHPCTIVNQIPSNRFPRQETSISRDHINYNKSKTVKERRLLEQRDGIKFSSSQKHKMRKVKWFSLPQHSSGSPSHRIRWKYQRVKLNSATQVEDLEKIPERGTCQTCRPRLEITITRNHS